MTVAYIALGSNLNHPRQQLQTACEKIALIADTTVIARSRVYDTTPVGPQDQPDYKNQVIAIDTKLSPHALLSALQAIENEMGRVRTRRWGERMIDCDIILFGHIVMQTPELTIPHPEYKKRDFVLYPLLEIAPALELL